VLSFVQRMRDLAAEDPAAPAVTLGEQTLARGELDDRSDALARVLREHGVGLGDLVSMAVPNGPDWFVAFEALWKVGATPQPLNVKMADPEMEAVIDLAESKVLITADAARFPHRTSVAPTARLDDGSELPDVVSPSWKAPTSGGSTGRPKLIVATDAAQLDPDLPPLAATFGIPDGGCLVMPGPLYHNGPLIWSWATLLSGGHVVVFERFDAEATLAAVEAHRGDVLYAVPTMMKRIWRLPEEVRTGYDLSSLRLVWHLAEPCPIWLKRAWIGWLGPERIIELYAGTEAQLSCVISGTEWLEHEGSVGKPLGGEISIRDPEGNEVPVGEEGEVWLRSARPTPGYRYVGAEARTLGDGWESLGDMGRVDADGYLYLGDRSTDMVLVGGANVYPAEVEGVLGEHPAVRSCAVIGLPDEDKGNRLHAIVEADPGSVDEEELLAWVREHLSIYKVPRSVELVQEPLRDDAGKLRRAALRAERLGAPPA
jgi:bile acid-coenzyme A ligase